jgi:FixJ family two-component response regulator
MPNLSGPELALQLRRTRSDLKIIYSSGYTDRGLEEIKQGLLGANFLQKPFSIAELKRKVREVLDSGVPLQ